MNGSALPVPIREQRCARCGAVNRVGAYSLDKLPMCGKCQTALPEPMAKRIKRKLLAHWLLLTIVALTGWAVWSKPALLTDLFTDRPQSPAEKAAAEYCAHYPQPVTGVQAAYNPDDRVAPLTIKTSAGGGYFIKLEQSISGNPVMTFFVRGGETLRATVPEGSFVLKYATGDR